MGNMFIDYTRNNDDIISFCYIIMDIYTHNLGIWNDQSNEKRWNNSANVYNVHY